MSEVKHGAVPVVASFSPDGVPESLKMLPCWVAWIAKFRNGRWNKVPLDSSGAVFEGRSPAPYSYAEAASQGHGVGVVAGQYEGGWLAAGDADDAVGDAELQAQVIGLCTYCERSPSKRGFRFLFRSKVRLDELAGKRNGNELKVSCSGFWTVTGDRLQESPAELADLTEQGPMLLSELFECADTERRAQQLLEWLEPPAFADVMGKSAVWNALTRLARWRVVEYSGWIRVVWCLASGGEGHLEQAKEWSKGCPEKYEKGAEEVIHRAFVEGPPHPRYNLRRIGWWAKTDDPTYEPPGGWYESLTTSGNANIVGRLAAGKLIHVDQWKSWASWDGRRWASGGDGPWKDAVLTAEAAALRREEQVQGSYRRLEAARIAAQSLPPEALAAVTLALRDRQRGLDSVMAWVSKSKCLRGHAGFADTLAVASTRGTLRASSSQVDQHRFLLNCSNGTLDLRTGTVREHRPSDMITQLCPTEWQPQAVCPRWRQFMLEVFKGDAALAEFMQRLLGCCLTGDVSDQVLPVLWGDGSNGKSKLVNTVLYVLGKDYADVTPRRFLAERKYDGHPTEMAVFYGKRFMVESEMGQSIKLDEELVKRLTGGNHIKCRRMHEDFWTFEPTHKLLVETNHKPVVEGLDHGIRRRIKLVPFTQRFWKPGDERKDGDLPADPGIEETLQKEASGILTWMAEGCRLWMASGLGEPPAVTEATKEYFDKQSLVKRFLSETFHRAEGERVKKERVRHLWEQWCRDEGVPLPSKNAFTRELTACGITYDTNSNYVGLKEKVVT